MNIQTATIAEVRERLQNRLNNLVEECKYNGRFDKSTFLRLVKQYETVCRLACSAVDKDFE